MPGGNAVDEVLGAVVVTELVADEVVGATMMVVGM